MKTITLIRHAQSNFNAREFEHEDQMGNCRLSSKGIEQAGNLDFTFDILIISPMKRALETYVNSNIKSNKILINDLFREIKNDQLVNHLDNEEIQPESEEDISKRALQAIVYLKDLEHINIGVLSHGAFMRKLLIALEQKDISDIIFNCETHKITM